MQLFFEPIWWWPLVAMTSAGLVALVLVTYRVQLANLPRLISRVLLSLRLLSIVVLTFAMFRPALQQSDTDNTPVQLLVLSDVSRSMNTADIPGGHTRFYAVQHDLEKYEPKWKDLGKQVELRQFDFARDLAPHDPGLKEGIGDQTAFGKVLDDLLREARDRRSLGLILLTDGAQRAIPPFDADPMTAARKLGDHQIPIYAVGYGASDLSTASLDLAVEDVRVDPVVFEKKLIPITCKIRALGANGKKIRVRVLIEDRTKTRVNESGELKPAPSTQNAMTVREIEVKGESITIPVDLSFVPTVTGEVKVAVEVEPAQNELLLRNNRRERIVTVKQGGLNVAYFDIARTEQKFIRMVNGADKIQLDFHEVRTGKFADQNKPDPAWFQKGRYDVFIIGDVQADWLGADNLKQLEARVRDGAGLLMIGGLQNFAQGGYANSPLADWLPVQMNPGDFQPNAKMNLDGQLPGDVEVIPTARGLKEYVMQLGTADKNRALWKSLPKLNGANRLKPKDLAKVWAESANREPLLLVSDVARARVAAFAGDSTYLWVTMEDYAELHQRFWRQMILWLARKEADTDQPIWIKVEPRNYTPGAVASLSFGARTADGSPANNTDLEVDVTKPDTKNEKLSPRKNLDESSAEFSSTVEPGDYWARVTSKQNGQSAYARFIVDSRDLELDYPSTDYDFLKELAAASGGTTIKPEELGALVDRLKQTNTQSLTRIKVISLWDNWWLLIVFVGLMTIEWFIRKKRGLV